MSRTLSAPWRGTGAAWAGAIALALVALLALALAPRANAEFTTGKCAGADIIGRGASFARDAHNLFINNFKPIYCKGTPKLAGVSYEALGSGAGRLSMKERGLPPRFGMSDEPPTPAEVAQMNAGTGNEPAGTDTEPADNGNIHVIPAAVGAVAALVNFPDGCDVTKLDAASRTPEENLDLDGTPDDVVRVLFTKAEFEHIWSQGTSGDPLVSWKDVFPELDAVAACEKPIIRVVRFDDSGTTFAFKDYLNTIDPAEGWKTTYVNSGDKTRVWPAPAGAEAPAVGSNSATESQCGTTAAPGGKLADNEDHLTSGCSNGNGALVAKLVATDGSVGYSDVSTARNNSPSLAITPEANDNDTYWTEVQNGSDEFEEPTSSPIGFRTDGPKGANCQATEFENVPSTTFGDWSQASGVKSPTGYGICTMTYGLVFDDNSDVWGSSPAEEAKARTVKDYWENIVSEPAQAALFPNDYAPLPEDVLAISRAGVASVNWEGTSGGGGGTDVVDPKTDSGGSTPAPLPLKPSNLFSLPRKSISSKTGGATISVKLPGAGKLVMIGTAKVQAGQRKNRRKHRRNSKRTKTIKVGQVVLNASKAGTYNLSLRPSGAAKQELRKKGKLRVSLKLTFTPAGGEAKTTTTGLTLKLKQQRKGKRKHRSGKRR
jgi:ABC-type phosphate transport system substrate-binding protein